MVRFSRVCLAAVPMCHPQVIKSRQWMRYDGGNMLQYQDHYEGLRALPLKAMECDFFHRDALSSAVAMKSTCDLQLTLMASSLYRLLGTQVGRGYAAAKGRHIFRDFIDAVGLITLTADEIIVRYQKRAHNPLLIAAGFANTNVP